jgi:Zn-dependent protease
MVVVLLAIQAFHFFLSLSLHEFAHGWAAWRLGDPTAKNAGRLTIDPRSHIDPFGTIILPIFLILIGSPLVIIGAKPVPVNMDKLSHGRWGIIAVALAGPFMNFALALMWLIPYVALKALSVNGVGQLALAFCAVGVLLNLGVGIFNLIPVPPLDGGRVVTSLLGIPQTGLLDLVGLGVFVALLASGTIQRIMGPFVMGAMRMMGIPM